MFFKSDWASKDASPVFLLLINCQSTKEKVCQAELSQNELSSLLMRIMSQLKQMFAYEKCLIIYPLIRYCKMKAGERSPAVYCYYLSMVNIVCIAKYYKNEFN